jgi:hypothetical protein
VSPNQISHWRSVLFEKYRLFLGGIKEETVSYHAGKLLTRRGYERVYRTGVWVWRRPQDTSRGVSSTSEPHACYLATCKEAGVKPQKRKEGR